MVYNSCPIFRPKRRTALPPGGDDGATVAVLFGSRRSTWSGEIGTRDENHARVGPRPL